MHTHESVCIDAVCLPMDTGIYTNTGHSSLLKASVTLGGNSNSLMMLWFYKPIVNIGVLASPRLIYDCSSGIHVKQELSEDFEYKSVSNSQGFVWNHQELQGIHWDS